MSETLMIALAKLAISLGLDVAELIRRLVAGGWEPTNEELVALRKASQDEVDRFHRLTDD